MHTILIDRDGTVIVDPPDERVDKISKIKLFPDTIEALTLLAKANYAVIFITNQVGIAEGRITEQEFTGINQRVIEMLAPSGIKVLKTYICPHSPDDNCTCRKSKPTLLLQAAKDYNLDLPNTFMIGDRPSDIRAGLNAGTKTVLVQTGNTAVEAPDATYTAPTLLDAVRFALAT